MTTQLCQSKAMGANEDRKPTRRGRALTTLPRLLQRDLRERLTAHERRARFSVYDLESGRRLSVLRMKAENRGRWRSGVEATVEKERMRWIQRSAAKSRKRAAEKAAYERRKKDEETRKRQRATEAGRKRQRAVDQRFRRQHINIKFFH